MICRSTIHTERIVEFPLEQWLRERATVLRYTYNTFFLAVASYVEIQERNFSGGVKYFNTALYAC